MSSHHLTTLLLRNKYDKTTNENENREGKKRKRESAGGKVLAEVSDKISKGSGKEMENDGVITAGGDKGGFLIVKEGSR